MDTNKKSRYVWAVVTADPHSDEPGYLAYVSLFASRSSALQNMRNAAKEDAESFGGSMRWYDEDTDEPWCEVVQDGRVCVTHSLECKIVYGDTDNN